MIGSCSRPITGKLSNYRQLSSYNFADELEQNTAVYSPITFKEIVIVMINTIITRPLRLMSENGKLIQGLHLH